jgi:hypothetical protein
VFAKSFWKEEVVDYCVALEEFFERTFEANEEVITDWNLVLKVFDSLVQDTFTKITCAEVDLTSQQVHVISREQLSTSNETVRAMWDKLTRKSSSNQGVKRKAEGSQDAPRSLAMGELLKKLPLVSGKHICVKFLLGKCNGAKEGEKCPNSREGAERIHSKVPLSDDILRELEKKFGGSGKRRL